LNVFRNDKEEIIRAEDKCSKKAPFFCDVPLHCYAEFCLTGTGALQKAVKFPFMLEKKINVFKETGTVKNNARYQMFTAIMQNKLFTTCKNFAQVMFSINSKNIYLHRILH
jgi:hypothetical protein